MEDLNKTFKDLMEKVEKALEPVKCGFCGTLTTEKLHILDKETLQEIPLCVTCWYEVKHK